MLTSYVSDLFARKISERFAAGLVSAVLGLVFVAGVGFAGPQLIHDAAHDTRHAFTFPCH